MVPLPPRLYQVGYEQLYHERLGVERPGHFIHEHDVETFSPSIRLTTEGLHRNNDLGNIAKCWYIDRCLLHDIGKVFMESRAHVNVDLIAMCLGVQSPGHDTFLRSRRDAGLLPTHHSNTDVEMLVGMYPHWSLNHGRFRSAMVLLPPTEALNLFKQRSFAARHRFLPT